MRLISLLIVTFVSVRDGQAARRGGGVRRRRLESNFFEQSATITQSIEYESAGGDTFFASGTGIKPISKGSKSSKTKSSKSKKAPPVKGAPGPGGPKGVNTKAPGPGRDPKGSKGENSGPSSKGAGGPKGPKSKDMESQGKSCQDAFVIVSSSLCLTRFSLLKPLRTLRELYDSTSTCGCFQLQN